MRAHASILHLDLDAFYASVEQRDKPSLRGKPVVVGGIGGRGVVATASYEARVFGVRSAMSTREARQLAPNAAYLYPRFRAYREASARVMALLRALSPLVEPLSLDEAYVDLAAAEVDTRSVEAVTALAARLREQVREATGGITASVGLASSKFLAKIASELAKPDGLRVIAPGTELDVLRPMSVRAIPGVGPATAEVLRRNGIALVADLEAATLEELTTLVGKAHGTGLHQLARGIDLREVVAERETKSIGHERTFDSDLRDRAEMSGLLDAYSESVAGQLARNGLAGRTVSIKVKYPDFTTISRSATLPAPTDNAAVVARLARTLFEGVDTSAGVRLLGVSVSGMADWVQGDLFETREEVVSVGSEGEAASGSPAHSVGANATSPSEPTDTPYLPGQDVVHETHGRGWVWGAGKGVVTVRFETAETGVGPVRSLRADDPALSRWSPPEDAGE